MRLQHTIYHCQTGIQKWKRAAALRSRSRDVHILVMPSRTTQITSRNQVRLSKPYAAARMLFNDRHELPILSRTPRLLAGGTCNLLRYWRWHHATLSAAHYTGRVVRNHLAHHHPCVFPGIESLALRLPFKCFAIIISSQYSHSNVPLTESAYSRTRYHASPESLSSASYIKPGSEPLGRRTRKSTTLSVLR